MESEKDHSSYEHDPSPESSIPPLLPEERDLFRQAARNQADELELRRHELELSSAQAAQSYEYSKLALEAQARDRTEARSHERGLVRYAIVGVVVTISIIAMMLVGLAMVGAENVALEIVKLLLAFALGGAGGYGVRVSREKQRGRTRGRDD